jgi:low affinity Fe/Cu permease
MVFLVQHTQNRDARALHLKLAELLRSVKDAHNRLINLENGTDEIEQISGSLRRCGGVKSEARRTRAPRHLQRLDEARESAI